MQIFGLVKQAFLALLFLSFGGLLVTKRISSNNLQINNHV